MTTRTINAKHYQLPVTTHYLSPPTSPASVDTLVLSDPHRSANTSEQDSWSASSTHSRSDVVTVTAARPPPGGGCTTAESVCRQMISHAEDLSLCVAQSKAGWSKTRAG